jgi:membrane-associated PAP2 superfamily phosphatase
MRFSVFGEYTAAIPPPHIPAPEHPLRSKLSKLWPWAVLLCLTLSWDASGADLHVMGWLGDTQGFALRDHGWLASVMHDGGKRVAMLMYACVLTLLFWPVGIWRRVARIQRLEVVVGITVSLLAVSALKRWSLTSCPWELQAFGGVASYVSHWTWGVSDGGSGHCFPGGHASSAFAFLALSLPWLTSLDPGDRGRGQKLLAAVVLAGLALGAAQTLRGAHYPSHTAWTAWICATVAWANHWVFAWWAKSNTRLAS